MRTRLSWALTLFFSLSSLALSKSDFAIARVRYRGGDWNEGPTTLPNFLAFVRERAGVQVDQKEGAVELTSAELFTYPFLFLTGHGRILLSDLEVRRLREYLHRGGFLYIDDDFGLNSAVQALFRRLYPHQKPQRLPRSSPLYHIFYHFPKGCPKIHEHYPGPPQVYGLFEGRRLAVLYTWNTNISDGWESPSVHGDPPKKREEALKMGTNILLYALLQ